MRFPLGSAVLLVALSVFSLALGRGPTDALGQGGMSPGSMNGRGMMQGMGMMGGPFAPSARPIAMDRAVQILKQWPAAHHLDGLVLDEMEAYTQNFYGQFKEKSTGRGGIQILVDRYSGRATPEMGPNMMWNTKYGHAMRQDMMGSSGMMGGMMNGMGMPGMMGGGSNQSPSPSGPQISLGQARQQANTFLSAYLPGATVGNGDAFYGYYHFDVMRGGHQVGMLSVSDASGSVWYHTWHGEFLEKVEVGR